MRHERKDTRHEWKNMRHERKDTWHERKNTRHEREEGRSGEKTFSWGFGSICEGTELIRKEHT